MGESSSSDAGKPEREDVNTEKLSLSVLAGLVQSRLAGIRFREWLKRGQVIVPVIAMVGIVALRVWGHWNSGEIWVALSLLFVWLLLGALWTRLHLANSLTALMVWDERSGSKDMFSSALFFEQKKGQISKGEKQHLLKAQNKLRDAREKLEGTLPLPSIKTALSMMALLLFFAVLPVLRPGIAAGDARLSDEMLDEAQRQGDVLADKAETFKSMEGLTDEEKAAAKKLQEMVKGVSEELNKSEGKSAREVLGALEQRARAAEKLAKKLAAGTDAWASQEMLKEMSQHADLADLSSALKDKNAQLGAAESDRLEGVLENPEIKEEVQQRMNTALARTMAAANKEDKSKPVGEHVGNASIKMESKQSKPAARDFGRLADHFRKLARREAAQKKMQQLANQLREAGSKISGSKLQQMKKLASNKAGAKMPKGMKPLQAGKAGKPGTSMVNNPINQQNTSQSQLPVPGIQNQPLGAGQMKQAGAAPVPGSKNAQQGGSKGQGKAMAMGQGQGKKLGAPGLMAPVPGQGQGMKAPGAGLGAGQGNGSSAGSAAAAAGGQNVGNGTTGLAANKTAAQKAVRDSKVSAQINADGESTTRSVQGKARQETAQRERQQAAVDFIKVEEQALDEQSLPLSRRDHVLKYFTALRERFEQEE